MAEYQLTAGTNILRSTDGATIPDDFANIDYQAYLAWRAAGGVADPVPPAPPLTAQQLLATKITAGIALTCTGAPALNATYALDDVSTAQIYQIGLYASQLGSFPSGGTTQAYPDITGVPHTFTIAQFIAFLRVVAPLVSALNMQASILAHGGTAAWPAQTAVIP